MLSPLLDPASHLLSRLMRFKVHNPWRSKSGGILPDGIHVVKSKNGMSADRDAAIAPPMGHPPAGQFLARAWDGFQAPLPLAENHALAPQVPAARLRRPSRACGTGSRGSGPLAALASPARATCMWPSGRGLAGHTTRHHKPDRSHGTPAADWDGNRSPPPHELHPMVGLRMHMPEKEGGAATQHRLCFRPEQCPSRHCSARPATSRVSRVPACQAPRASNGG